MDLFTKKDYPINSLTGCSAVSNPEFWELLVLIPEGRIHVVDDPRGGRHQRAEVSNVLLGIIRGIGLVP